MAKPVLRKPKKKVCQFCKEKVSYVDYKDTTLLASSSPTAARSARVG
jgi:ribosomal protein S18